MLAVIGAASEDDLFSAVPRAAFKKLPLDLPTHAPEYLVEARMRAMASRNRAAGDGPFFVGAGAYRHHVPASVDHLIQRSEWLTAYTPYQPEVSQGTLQFGADRQRVSASMSLPKTAGNGQLQDLYFVIRQQGTGGRAYLKSIAFMPE